MYYLKPSSFVNKTQMTHSCNPYLLTPTHLHSKLWGVVLTETETAARGLTQDTRPRTTDPFTWRPCWVLFCSLPSRIFRSLFRFSTEKMSYNAEKPGSDQELSAEPATGGFFSSDFKR